MRDCPDQLVRDYHVREDEHEKDDDIENDVSLLGVLTHRTDVDGMTLRDPASETSTPPQRLRELCDPSAPPGISLTPRLGIAACGETF